MLFCKRKAEVHVYEEKIHNKIYITCAGSNSYVYVPMGLDVATRAKILGHSVKTNLEHYTFARTDEYLDEVTEMLNSFNLATR